MLIIVDNNGNIFDENGTYTIALDAQYYNRLTTEKFTVTGKLNTAPSATSASKDESGNYIVHFDDSNAYAWQAKWTGITVNDKIYSEGDTLAGLNKNQYTWTPGAYGGHDLTLQENSFNKDGDSTITITAEGYEPLIIEVTAEGQLVDDSTTEPGGDTQPAPAAPTATVDEDGNVTLAFDSVDSSWKSAISSVEVNGVGYSAFNDPIGTPGEKNYQWKIDAYGGQELYLDNTSFVTGENNTVVIKAEGYKDLTVTVKIDGEEEPGETIKEVPAVLSYGASSRAIYFDKLGTNTAAESYLNAVAKVTVNGTEYQKSAYTSWLENNEYGILNGTDKYIKLDGTSFDNSGDTTIAIEADGYKTLTVTVHSDGTYTTSTSDPATEGEKQSVAGIDAP